MAHEPAAKPFYSVLILAFVCSLLVSGASVGLRSKQAANKALEQKKNILQAAGLFRSSIPVEEQFAVIETKIITLANGKFVPETEISPVLFNQLQAAKKPDSSRGLTKGEDKAGLRRLEKYSFIYLVKSNGLLDKVVLPVRGKGLWSTMHGYVALDADLSTIKGITFYEHGETPGLGAEIENKSWLTAWHGKKIFDKASQFAIRVVKGKVDATGDSAIHQVDGISGATLTINGVNSLLSFWFGEHGFKPFLDRFKNRSIGSEHI